jgi:hypothetical protein
MLIQVTESGRPVTFNSSKLVWVEQMPTEAEMRATNLETGKAIDYAHAGKTRIVLETGYIYADQTHDQIVDALTGKPGMAMVDGYNDYLIKADQNISAGDETK